MERGGRMLEVYDIMWYEDAQLRLLVPPSSYLYTLLPMHIDNSGSSVSCAQ